MVAQNPEIVAGHSLNTANLVAFHLRNASTRQSQHYCPGMAMKSLKSGRY